ncbi:hypothetical protein ASPACDRAFT_54536 [Aspergillus aculeatus ATCC 16872]|uniref:SMODS and SLOG-associating 2TM effector domain-containing protein n=1 Tax=Aspergillus aculeatus (strain ATCC 16872 / CBS 172.66 / WB 5094) TaxID=690307 RepID=A0A1L9WKL6_ASPA1|nr:uncharacterized protein ASPACDRAFT_54536 [Aspergillus aculeatus ATCC 16872]OJJ96693.1 hypothetical protein ASPACDRAFT_54536 [Aspergillus aculeatus ATCC 16872]
MPESSKSSRNGTSPHSYEIFRAATGALYKRLRAQETHKTTHNRLFSIVFNFLAILQLVVGATITALGPLSADHMVAITILGAINTIVAGVLALMKGRGLPQRLRKDLTEIRKVKTYIEEVEISLRYDADEQVNRNVMSLIKDCFNRYRIMQEVIDINQPDSYVNAPQLERGNQSGSVRVVDEEMGILAR